MKTDRQQQGLSLIELMIALGLGLALSAGVVTVFIQNSRSSVQDDELARMLENGRYLVRTLSRDIAMAGFWGKYLDVSTTINDASVAIGQDCGDGITPWAISLANLQFLDNVTVASTGANFECLPSADIVTGSDIVAIKRVSDSDIADLDIVTDQLYLRTNVVAATMFLGGAPATPPVLVGTVTNWAYLPTIFYLRNYSFAVGDGIPSLCRAFLNNASPPDMTSECLVEGVENMQVEFGVDDDNDFIVDFYTGAPTAADMVNSVAVRVHVMARSLNPIPNYINDKTYNLGTVAIAAANDGFIRRVFSTTIVLRNPANLSGIGS